MGVVIRQSIKGSIVSYFGVLVGYVNYLWIMPLALSVGEIGLFRSLIDTSLLFVPLVQVGVDSIVVKFYSSFANEKDRYADFWGYILLIPLVGFLVFCIGFWAFQSSLNGFFAEKSSLLVEYITYIVPLVFLIVYVNIFEAYATVKLRIVVPKIIRDVLVRLLTMLSIMLYFYQWIDFELLILNIVIIYFLQLLILVFYIYKLESELVMPKLRFYLDRQFKEMFTYSMYMLLGRGSGMIVSRIDTIMTASLLGLMDTGIYSIAYFIGMVLDMPRRALTAMLAPLVARALNEGDIKTVEVFYKKSSLNQIVAGMLLFILLWSNIDMVFYLMPNSETFIVGKYVVLFIAVSRLINMVTGINAEIIINSKYYRWNIFLMPFLAIIAIVSNYIFIPLYGITGTAIATALSVLLYDFLRGAFVFVKFKIHPFSIGTIKCFAISGLVMFLALIIPVYSNMFIDFILRTIGIVVAYSVLTLYTVVSPDINETFFKMVDRVRQK